MLAKTNYLTQVDGSCYYEAETGTKVLCAVTGPIEPKARQELPTQLALEINVRPAKTVSTTREVNIQDKVRSAITPIIVTHKYPRQLCQISLQVLQAKEDDGIYHLFELISCINATVFALINAGIALNSIALGVPIIISKDGEIVTHPSSEALRNSKSFHGVVFQIKKNKPCNVLYMDSYGDFSEEDIFTVLHYGEKKVLELNSTFREIIKESMIQV